MSEWVDRSVLEAASWRLATELIRRHPDSTRLIRGFPGGGQNDVLWIQARESYEKGDLRLNRDGTIQVVKRFDGRSSDTWQPTSWDEYLRADPHDFLISLEAAAGLPRPGQVPATSPTTLVLRILAAIASTAVKSVNAMDIQSGYIDTAGYGGGPNTALGAFPAIPADLVRPRDDDFCGQPGYRFWIVVREGNPILALEQTEGLAWTRHHDVAFRLMGLYEESRRHLLVTALKLLRRVDQI